MTEFENGQTGHEVTLSNREQASVKGVIHVESFDDEEIVLETNLGTLTIKGEDLHIKQLDLDSGHLSIEGTFNGLSYEVSSRRRNGDKGKNFMQRIFR